MMHLVFLYSFVPVCIAVPSYILCCIQGCPGTFYYKIYRHFFSEYVLFQINFWHCISWLICYKSKVILINTGRISGQEYAPFSIPWYVWLSKLNLDRRHLPIKQGDLSWVSWIKSCFRLLKRCCHSRGMLRETVSITEFTLTFPICIHLIK